LCININAQKKVERSDRECDMMIGDHLPTTRINHHRMAFLPTAKFRFFSIKERDHQLTKSQTWESVESKSPARTIID